MTRWLAGNGLVGIYLLGIYLVGIYYEELLRCLINAFLFNTE